MTNFETSLLAAAELVAPELLDLIARAQEDTLPSLRKLNDHALRQCFGPLMLRAHVAQELSRRKSLDTDGWLVTTDPLHMASIKLFNPDLDASFRFLKERQTYPGSVPTAKAGTRREIDWQPSFFGAPRANTLLWLFDIIGIESSERWETPSRFVRPLGSVQYGKPVPYDLSVPLIAEPGFYASRTFDTHDDADFFAQFSRTENESTQ